MKGGFVKSWFCIIIFIISYAVSSAKEKERSASAADTIQRETTVKSELAYLELKKGYYSVIGVFDNQVNAIRLAKQATEKGLEAKYGYVFDVKRYYVYTSSSEDYEAVKTKKNALKASTEHKDAWVLKYLMEKNALPTLVSSNSVSPETSIGDGQAIGQSSVSKSAKPMTESLYKTYNLLVKVTSEISERPVDATVKLINTEKAKLLANVQANQTLTLNLPKAENPNVEFVCDVFGFQKMSMHVNLESLKASDSIGDFVSKYADTILVNIKLKPYKTGDVIVMYNVYFFDNSSIIRPISKTQLNTVFDMLNENKKMQVNIHGHTNGDEHGEIIKLEEGDTTFFQMTPKNVRTNGSAYTLSHERALTIKRWLVYRGIDAKRLDTKAWGGKKRLYDHPLDFGKNIRVELEILKDIK
jgi:outer membrane protein OmpA-like peptidoglycan-associated protein